MTDRRTLLKTTATLAAVVAGGSAPGPASGPRPSSVKADGFRAPLESDPHERTFMQWPARAALYGGPRGLVSVQATIALLARSIARFEPVTVLARPQQSTSAAAALGPAITVWPIATDDLWCRDSGPTFVLSRDGKMAVSDLGFNGWGGRQTHANDALIAKRVAERLQLPLMANGIVGEAGGVEVDGDGTAIAHESSWINKNRNRQSKAHIEQLLLDALGADTVIWAPGIKGADITDYHIDALARFVRPGQVLIQLGQSPDRSDPWSVAGFETYRVLKAARDARGRALDIVVLPEPVRVRSLSPSFVSSYVNYYVCNGAVIGAEFGDDTADAKAAAVLKQLYPGRTVVSLNVDPLGEAGGGIHCATQQKPKAASVR